MSLKKIIEKLRELKSDLDNAFDEGKIDLDKISAGLDGAATDLETLEKTFAAEKLAAHKSLPSDLSAVAASKTQTVEVADYR